MKHLLDKLIFGVLLLTSGCIPTLGQNQRPPAHPTNPPQKMEMDGSTLAMSARHMEMGPHMKMTGLRRLRPGDKVRADEIVRTARQVLEQYRDYKTALRDGFQIFLPQVPQHIYHFTNYQYALEAETRFNPERPTSLLYEKQGDNYILIGAMYTAPARFSEDDLDKRIPLSIAQWHEHVNFCLPPHQRQAELFTPHPLFGLTGSIATKEECDRAGGTFVPRLFGWMVHVYPFEQRAENIWSLEEQASAQTGMMMPSPASRDSNIKESIATFESEGKSITVEQYEPLKPGKHPPIVLLYGSGGMTIGGPMFQHAARVLAAEGYAVYLPHYFDRTGTQFADPETDKKYFAVWMKTITDTIAYAGKQPEVDGQHIGLLGYSLGAYLSLSVAAVNPQVKAVVEYFGGMPEFFATQLKRMPPTLILHGDADPVVSVKEAYKLEQLLKSRNLSYEMKIYPQEGHGFKSAVAEDALQRTHQFFERNLKGPLKN